MAQRNLSTDKKIMDLENRQVVAKGKGEGLGAWGKLMQNVAFRDGLTMGSCCIALGTLSSQL